MKKLGLIFLGLFLSLSTFAQLVSPSITEHPGWTTRNSFRVEVVDPNTTATYIEILIETENSSRSVITTFSPFSVPTINSLMPNTLYSIKVRDLTCATVAGCPNIGPFSNTIYIRTLVDSPAPISISVVNNCPRFVGVSWTPSARANQISNYVLQKSLDGVNYRLVANLPSYQTVYYDQETLPGKNVWYRIFSENISGKSSASTPYITVKPFTGPSIPLNLNSNPNLKTENQVAIRWENPANETECNSNTRTANYVKLKRAGETEYKVYDVLYPEQNEVIIKGLKTKEPIEVQIYSLSDQGLFSPYASIKDTTLGKPLAPSNLIIVLFKDALANDVIGLGWKDNSNDEDYFDIEFSTDSLKYNPLGRIKKNSTVLNHLPLEQGVKYFYRVRSGNIAYGNSEFAYSDRGFLLPYQTIPSKPTGLAASPGIGLKVNLRWFDNAMSEESFVIEKSIDDNKTFKELKKVVRNTSSYVDSEVAAGKTYYYRLKAVNPKGSSDFSNEARADIKAGTSSIPTDFAVVYPNPTIDNIKIDLSESNLKDNVSIEIFDQSQNLVLKNTQTKRIFDLNLTKLNEGLYTIVISDGDEKISKKVFKK